MSATATNDERLVGKLLGSTALVLISAGYGYWQKTGDLDNCDNAATDFVSLTRRGRFLQLTMSEGRSSLQGFDNG